MYYLQAGAPQGTPTAEQELLRVAIAINSGETVEQIISLIFDTMHGLIPYDRIAVAMLEPGDVLNQTVVRSDRPIVWGVGARASICGSSLGPIIHERRIRIINDLAEYARQHPDSHSTAQILAEGMRASLTVPLVSARGPLGILFLSSTEANAYQERHVDLVRALAEGIAMAVQRANVMEALRRANEEIRTLDQLKNDFLSNLSHELRTPLSIVVGYLEVLEDEVAGSLTPEQHRMLREGLDGALRLNSLLNDLFEFTELESGLIALRREPTDLVALVREVCDEASAPIKMAGLDFVLRLPDHPVRATVDARRVARALQSLLDNARKFTHPPGTITLSLTASDGTAWLVVKDTGIGIRPEHQAKVFEKFFQAETGASRERGGTGLGLPLARAIALAHGGDVELKSEPGKGSTFRIRLPLSTAP
jgi:signal transduction histidine kinase